MADIDYEQQNRIRIALGLKPLPIPGASTAATATATTTPGPKLKDHSSSSGSEGEEPASTLETRQAAGYDNWKQLQDDAEAKKRRAAKAEAVKRARDAAQKYVKLEGKGLGDADPDIDRDTRSWLLGAKKRQKKLERERARRMEEELAERERLAAIEYGAKDLAGVKVGHEIEAFDEDAGEGEQILTLKDTTIDENEEEGDELENVNLKEREKLRERLELKKRKPVYDPHAVDENGERKILGHYDEEIEGKKRKHFVFDGQGTTVEEREAKRQLIGEKLKNQPISLDFLRYDPKSDYMDVSEVKMKKPKKSKKKATRQRAIEDDEVIFTQQPNGNASNHDAMDVDGTALTATKKPKAADKDFVDDEDLQASLAAQRRATFKKRKKQRPEDIARQIQEEGSATPGEMDVNGNGADEGEPGLVIDETSEFVANLQRPTDIDGKAASKVQQSIEKRERAESGEDEDVDMEQTYNDVDDEEALLARLKRERSATTPDLTTTGLDEEATLDQGLGAAFNLLRQRGLVKTADMGDTNALHRDRQRFLAEKQRREAEAEQRARLQRERDRASGKLERMSAREREEHARWENKQRDQLESRQMADVFNREYKPDVQLKYVDEHGRSMNQKEAFKHLSHQFHGKGSGKQKTEKHLKKIADEKKREAMSALDASQAVGMNNAMGTTAKRNKQAGVRLG